MNRKEAIEKIKKLVFGEEITATPPDPEVFGTEYKLADGTPIMIDKLEAGGIAKIGDAVAPDGVHSLEDGTSFEIKDGLIVMVMPKAEDPEESEMKKEMIEMKKQFESFKTDFETLKGKFEKVSVKADTQEKANQELTKLVEFLAEEPTVAPAQPQKKFEEMTPLERFRFQKQNAN
jgi:hypothetical protein